MKTKLTSRQNELLLEAARRYICFHNGESLTEAWTGLGCKTLYKPAIDGGYMTYVHRPNDGFTQWWKLTEKGAQIVQEWLNQGITFVNYERKYLFELMP